LRFWLFFSKSLENIETAVKHLLWGFPSKDRIKEKDEKTTEEKWEKYLGYYNSKVYLDLTQEDLEQELSKLFTSTGLRCRIEFIHCFKVNGEPAASIG